MSSSTRQPSGSLALRLAGFLPLLLMMGLAPSLGCGDATPASKPQINPPGGGKDGSAGRGGQGGPVTGMGGTGGAGGSGGTPAADAAQMPDTPAPPPPATDGGSTPDAPVAPDSGEEPDATPPDTEPPPPACVVNMPCTVEGGGNGLCRNAMCVACNGQGDDATCVKAYGANTICAGGRCVVQNCANSRGCPNNQLCEGVARICQACKADAECKADAVYGANTICIGGRCLNGNCHANSMECMAGKICGRANNTCGNCQNSAQCEADPLYKGHVCNAQGTCVVGDCVNSNQCNGARDGLICNVAMANRCGPCTSDMQCQQDARYRGLQRTTCFVGDGADKGKCVTNACMAVNTKCPQNPATFCCAGANNQRTCVAGDCCTDAQCLNGQRCQNNKCTALGVGCEEPMNNALVVDPINGVDTSTGSGRAMGAGRADCAFRTITAALASAARGVGNTGTITIVGQPGRMTEIRTQGGSAADPAEDLPITIPANVNVRITTSGGALLLRVARANAPAFRIASPRFELVPDGNARLNIDGAGVAGGSGIEVAAGSATIKISNVTIQNTREAAIQVQAGNNVELGPGLVLTRAGALNARAAGLEIGGGNVHIVGTAQIEANTGSGIAITGNGALQADGVLNNNGTQSTITIRNNGAGDGNQAGVSVLNLPGAGEVQLTGVLINAHQGSGIRVGGGAKLRLRGSAITANGTGVLIVDGVNASRDLGGIDLGRANEAGDNVLQAIGNAQNRLGGICFDLGAPVAATIQAQRNQFGNNDCSVMAGVKNLNTSASCTGGVDVAIPADQPDLKVDATFCNAGLQAPEVPQP